MKKYLNDTEVKEELINYICSTKINYALLISGTWGCGKTFFVKEFIKELEQENKFSKINAIYISLYGLHDISEIKDKIVLCSIKNKKAQKIIPYLNIGLSTISDIVSGITNVKNADKKIKSIINQIYKIDNLVIFIDDIERCDIDINSILGYINELVEHNGVKAVLIADEEKIGRINFNRNVELKYILGFLNSSQFEKNVSDSNNQNTKTISKEELINNANEIFSEDIIYNEIKEKLIGRVISYKANINLVYDKFVDEIIDNKFAKCTAINNKKSFLQQLEINNYHNLRTIQFILSSFNRLVNETLNLANLDDIKEIYLNDLFNYCIIKSIKLKQGIKSYNWDKNQNFGTVYLGNENEYIFKNFATGFKFVDDYLENAYLNKKYIKECDYLENDYYGAVASCIEIKESTLKFAYICDSGVIVYDKLGNIKFQTEDDKKIYSDPYKREAGLPPWYLSECGKIVRSKWRNNPDNIIDGKCVSFGAITGEKEAISFIKSGEIDRKRRYSFTL